MKKIVVFFISMKKIIFALFLLIIVTFLFFYIKSISTGNSIEHIAKTIVIDPGHGGIDGGTNREGILEKDINLDLAKKLKSLLEQKKYKTILTRESDISLDSFCKSEGSRHQKDLKYRTEVINNSEASIFVSIHTNCHIKNLQADGSIILYNEKFPENKILAYSIQRALNNMVFNNLKRTVHDPLKARFYLLENSVIPGVIIETIFLTNEYERNMIQKDEFREEIAKAISNGIDKYYSDKGDGS